MLHLYSRLLNFRRAGDVKQFASILQPCPTTSRPRDIPAGNIRQRQTDSSPHLPLNKSPRGCGAGVSEELSQTVRKPRQPHLSCRAGAWTQICEENADVPATTTTSMDRLIRPSVYPYPRRTCQPISFTKNRAERRDLLGHDTMFVCYSPQE
jgi:hypothetical protein